jgi:hypothetical protein
MAKDWSAVPPKLRARVRAIVRKQAQWREQHVRQREGGEEHRAEMAAEAEALRAAARALDFLDVAMRKPPPRDASED